MRFLRLALTILLGPPIFALAALCAGAAVAAQFGRASLQWDLLTHFAPFWLAGALVLGVAGLAFRGYTRALIVGMAVVGTLASASLIAPELLRSTGPHAPADAPAQLKIVQFNVWHSNDDVERAVDWLIAQRPDVVILEETRPELRRMLAERTRWHVACPECEVMILSPMKPIETRPPQLGGRPAGPLSFARFRRPDGDFTVVGVHYAWPTDAKDQQAQEARLARVLGGVAKDRAIVAGDMNSAPWSFSRACWDRAFGLIRRDRALFTWPAQPYKRLHWLGVFPFLPIDHVYAGAGWATVKVERGPRLGSDHYPVVMTLAPVGR